MLMHHANIWRQAACNTNDGLIISLCNIRYAYRDFAMDRLTVNTPFPGHN